MTRKFYMTTTTTPIFISFIIVKLKLNFFRGSVRRSLCFAPFYTVKEMLSLFGQSENSTQFIVKSLKDAFQCEN